MEKNHYTCIPAIDIDSVLKNGNKRAYLDQCKNKLKKRKAINFIDDEIIDENYKNNYENYSYEEISIKEELRL